MADWTAILSGGQKQRLGWCRLYYRKPAFALVDEGTSAVDLYGNVNSSVSPSFAAEARAVLRTRPAFLIYLNAGMAVSQVGDYHL